MEENRKRKTELLSPAGSFDILKAVLHAGADAVYCAGNRFGARAYADNFNQEELLSAIDYVHLREKKLYLTVNTLLKERELEEELYEYLLPYYEAGLDAVIVQDLGVVRFIRIHFPELPIHASTQMTITGAYGAELMQKAGCSRIVTARELSLEEIKEIYEKTGAEIESFVHGALCYSYSGQCLLSSMIGGRSGNRGRCAQPCRLPYELEQGKKSPAYLLSPKDLCTIDLIPELISHGIHSFKIEGRMKQAEYAAGVTSIYRSCIDRYEAAPDQPYQVAESDRRKLLDLGNRCGFTDGYYKRHNGREMMTLSKPSHEKGKDSLQQQIRDTYIKEASKEKIKGILTLSQDIPARLVLKYKKVCVKITGEVVQEAQKQPLSLETVLEKMKKTGNTPFAFAELSVEMEPDVFLPVGALNELRRRGLEQLEEACQMPYRRKVPKQGPNRTGHIPVQEHKGTVELRVLTETREQLSAVLEQPEAARVYLEWSMLEEGRELAGLSRLAADIHAAGKEAYLALPYIFRRKTAAWMEQHITQIAETALDGYLVRNLEEIGFLNKYDKTKGIQADYGVYAYSNEAVTMLQELGISHTTLPVEYNQKELLHIGGRNRELIIYGRQPLMLSAQCVHKNTAGCDHKTGIFYLKDRYGKLFPVKNNCRECYNVLYNVNPLALFHQSDTIRKIAPEGIRLSFTTESKAETAAVFEVYRRVYQMGEKPEAGSYIPDFTNGHLKRGVE